MRKASFLFIAPILGMSLIACTPKPISAVPSTPSYAPGTKMHPSWDADHNGINDCETNGSCDHTIDYSQPRPAPVSTPTFDCSTTAEGSIERLICQDPLLAQLDQNLAGVYRAAGAKAPAKGIPTLQAEQRGWIKGRNECWKKDDKFTCVKTEYERRIAELQASYQLVSTKGPFRFRCGSSAADTLVVTFYDSDTPTLIAARGNATSLMYQVPAASGSKYEGRNESFWEHQGEARVTWGYGAPELVCTKAN